MTKMPFIKLLKFKNKNKKKYFKKSKITKSYYLKIKNKNGIFEFIRTFFFVLLKKIMVIFVGLRDDIDIFW
jgi:hypothetical protein